MKYMENATSWLIRVTMYAHVTYNSIHMNVRKETILYTCGNNRIYLHILHLSIMIINKIVFISIHQFSKKKGLCDISMPRWDSMHTATFLKGGKCHKGLFFCWKCWGHPNNLVKQQKKLFIFSLSFPFILHVSKK